MTSKHHRQRKKRTTAKDEINVQIALSAFRDNRTTYNLVTAFKGRTEANVFTKKQRDSTLTDIVIAIHHPRTGRSIPPLRAGSSFLHRLLTAPSLPAKGDNHSCLRELSSWSRACRVRLSPRLPVASVCLLACLSCLSVPSPACRVCLSPRLPVVPVCPLACLSCLSVSLPACRVCLLACLSCLSFSSPACRVRLSPRLLVVSVSSPVCRVCLSPRLPVVSVFLLACLSRLTRSDERLTKCQLGRF